MLEIYIARHGQNKDNVNGILNGHRDEPLTELGIQQAQELARHIKEKGLEFGKVFTSPLDRAYITARIITEELRINPPDILPDLIERDFGVMTGKNISEIEELCSPDIIKTDTITYFLDPEGAETFPDLIDRSNRLFNHLEYYRSFKKVLLVCHGDIGKMIYATYYKLPWRRVLTDFHFGNSELLLLSPNTKSEDAHVFKQQQFNH